MHYPVAERGRRDQAQLGVLDVKVMIFARTVGLLGQLGLQCKQVLFQVVLKSYLFKNSFTLRNGSDSKLSLAIFAFNKSRKSESPDKTHRRSYPSIKNTDLFGFCFSKFTTFSDHPLMERNIPDVC